MDKYKQDNVRWCGAKNQCDCAGCTLVGSFWNNFMVCFCVYVGVEAQLTHLWAHNRAAPCVRCSASCRPGGKCARTALRWEGWRSWPMECCYRRFLGKSVAGDEITADGGGGRTAEQISFAVMWQPIHRCLQRLTHTQQIAVIQGQWAGITGKNRQFLAPFEPALHKNGGVF